ncbi:MAG: exodeoxyribonuclease V subunit gamma [Lonepinella koalarum]|nr:exodeoxyribonuclease V subunit gamma [Lonepinella koalarum]
MLTVYHSNHLETQKEILLHLIHRDPLSDPFESETILVQSPGMAKWLQLQIAEKLGVAANINFPMPASFLWQQYMENFTAISEQNQFSKEAMSWHLLGIIQQLDLSVVKDYLRGSVNYQQKAYQLARQIADLFDQYLVYRPDWILHWEQHQDELIVQQIVANLHDENLHLKAQLIKDIYWQGELWRALVERIRQITQCADLQHRAFLHQQYLSLLSEGKPNSLPKRLFIFGISALPKAYLTSLQAISRYCEVHLFFTNPSKHYWGDIVDPQFLQKRYRTFYQNQQKIALLSEKQAKDFLCSFEQTQENERLLVGNPLLASWGKLGRDFLYLLTEMQPEQDIISFVEQRDSRLLNQVQRHILELQPSKKTSLYRIEGDRSLSIHACHSIMREVEILHDYLLQLFSQNTDLTPKDIIVMTADIEQYAPYVNAVFGQYFDNRYIPFSISDHKLSASDVLVSTFLTLLTLKESYFTAEEVFALLEVPAIRKKFEIEASELGQIHSWIENSGIRFGLAKNKENQQTNYNSWQAGLERLLLGNAMREEHGIWQDSLGFDNSQGLKGQLAGKLAAFIDQLRHWHLLLQSAYSGEQWRTHLLQMIDDFFAEDNQNQTILFELKQRVNDIAEQIVSLQVTEHIVPEVIVEVLTEKLDNQEEALTFLTGKVNFCTLLPMRSIPFKVVCLLGMNEVDYPRRHSPNGFDLMQYHHQKGDRARRDDDRYLFLEALLAAEEYFYISYIGRSITDNTEREPSVLVSQLLDYLQDNLDFVPPAMDEKGRTNNKLKPLVQYHSMQVFSPHNFNEKTHHTFAKEWLPLLNHQTNIATESAVDFVQEWEIEQGEISHIINFADIIAFVQHPVKFFFEKQLAVYFREQTELINDSENFELDALQSYQIRDELLQMDPHEFQSYFEKLTVKGVLPREHFGEVYQQFLSQEVQSFQAALIPYLKLDFISEVVELRLELEENILTLQAHLDCLLAQSKQRISWRISRFKDKYAIENWLIYLLQVVTNESVEPPVFYCKEKEQAVRYSFKTLEKNTALLLLKTYVTDYLAAQKRLVLAVTQDNEKFLKSVENPKIQQEHIEKIAKGDNYGNRSDLYWQRILAQQPQLNLTEINQKTQDWFAVMNEYLLKSDRGC